MALLELEDVSAAYGAAEALRGVSLAIEPGEIVALLGANGAGKTTLLNVISGLVKAKTGVIRFNGLSLRAKKPHQIQRLGLAHCPEGRRIFPGLTVLENLRMGAYHVRRRSAVEREMERGLNYFPVLRQRLRQKGGTLSGGEQQMLAIARALMSAPALLMLDEPSLGLAPKIIDQVFEIIERINREDGVTIFLVEQNANEALACASRGVVLENGAVTIRGTASALRHDRRVVEAYLGG